MQQSMEKQNMLLSVAFSHSGGCCIKVIDASVFLYITQTTNVFVSFTMNIAIN